MPTLLGSTIAHDHYEHIKFLQEADNQGVYIPYSHRMVRVVSRSGHYETVRALTSTAMDAACGVALYDAHDFLR